MLFHNYCAFYKLNKLNKLMILNKQAGRTDKAKAKEFAHIFFFLHTCLLSLRGFSITRRWNKRWIYWYIMTDTRLKRNVYLRRLVSDTDTKGNYWYSYQAMWMSNWSKAFLFTRVYLASDSGSLKKKKIECMLPSSSS